MTKHLCSMAATALGLVGLLVLSGCADRKDAEVKGTVTYNGQPIEKGAISFYPEDSAKGRPGGGPIVNGNYTVRAPVGMAKVAISMPKEVGRKKLYNTPNSPTQAINKESLPEKYWNPQKSELRLDVPAGGTTKNWELTGK